MHYFAVKEQCLVLFPYTAQNDDELSLEEGQVITIITREVEDKGWWKGEVDGKVGVFPDNFVKRVAPSLSEEMKELKPSPSKIVEHSEKPKAPVIDKPKTAVVEKPKAPVVEKPKAPVVQDLKTPEAKNTSVLSKASSFEKLKSSSEKSEKNQPEKMASKTADSSRPEKKNSIKTEISKSVSQVIKGELFKGPTGKAAAPKPKLSSFSSSRNSLNSVAAAAAAESPESREQQREFQRRISGALPAVSVPYQLSCCRAGGGARLFRGVQPGFQALPSHREQSQGPQETPTFPTLSQRKRQYK